MWLHEEITARNRSSSEDARRLRRQAPRLNTTQLILRLAVRPCVKFPRGIADSRAWIHGAIEAWTEFLRWAKWWEAGLSMSPTTPAPAASSPPPMASTPPEIASRFRGLSLPRNLKDFRGIESRRFFESLGTGNAPHSTGPPEIASRFRGPSRERLSILLLTKNEEARLAPCLDSVRWADEVVVVDGESTDRTRDIAHAVGATVVNRPFSGSFAQERNAGLDAATGDWVLQMDADDAVSPELRAAIERVLVGGSPHAALKVRRRNYFLGHRMRYGGWYHYNLVLFRRPACRYEGLVHERLIVQGTIGVVDGDLVHRPFDSLEQFVDRQNRYTTLQALELLQRPDRPDEGMIARQLRRRPRKVWWKLYVKKQGWREGMWGLVFSVLFAWVELMIWAKCWEATHSRVGGLLGRETFNA